MNTLAARWLYSRYAAPTAALVVLGCALALGELLVSVERRASDLRAHEAAAALRVRGADARTPAVTLGDDRVFDDTHAAVRTLDPPPGDRRMAVAAPPDRSLAYRFAAAAVGTLFAWAIHALLRHRNELSRLVLYDPLTGLPNRRLLEDRHAMHVARRKRCPEHHYALLFVDLDNFKPINDRHGHKVGDAVLRTVAERLRKVVRGHDTVARWGGDEFVILLDSIVDEAVHTFIARIHEQMAAPIHTHARVLRVGASIGAVHCPTHGCELPLLLELADRHMYRVKHAKQHDERVPARY